MAIHLKVEKALDNGAFGRKFPFARRRTPFSDT